MTHPTLGERVRYLERRLDALVAQGGLLVLNVSRRRPPEQNAPPPPAPDAPDGYICVSNAFFAPYRDGNTNMERHFWIYARVPDVDGL